MWGSGRSLAAALRRTFLAIGAVVLLGVTPALGETIDFTELPSGTSINGKTVKGVTFDYAVNGNASLDARVGATGPGTSDINKPPNLEGNTSGVLTLDFGTPVSELGFSYTSVYTLAAPNGLTVRMLDRNGITTSYDLAIAKLGAFSGLRYDHVPSVPIVRLAIDPNQTLGARFALDNVTFTPVPEPGALLLTCACAPALLARRRRR